eukprot:3639986-Rhodomonas_salina.1
MHCLPSHTPPPPPRHCGREAGRGDCGGRGRGWAGRDAESGGEGEEDVALGRWKAAAPMPVPRQADTSHTSHTRVSSQAGSPTEARHRVGAPCQERGASSEE